MEPVGEWSRDQHRLDSIEIDAATVGLMMKTPESDLLSFVMLSSVMALFTEAAHRHLTYPVLIASAQVARAFEHLGLKAQLIPTRARYKVKDDVSVSIGVLDRSLIDRSDGETNGHLVVWVGTLEKLIDLGPCQQPKLMTTTEDGSKIPASPIVGRAPGDLDALPAEGFQIISYQGTHWTCIPDLRPIFDIILGRHRAVVDDGGLALAHVAIDMLSAMNEYRDLTGSQSLGIHTINLITSRAKLPELRAAKQEGSPAGMPASYSSQEGRDPPNEPSRK